MREFKAIPDQYLHYGKQVFNTGLELDRVQEYLLIPLDIFLQNHHNISSKLDAWLYFLASDSPEDIRRQAEENRRQLDEKQRQAEESQKKVEALERELALLKKQDSKNWIIKEKAE